MGRLKAARHDMQVAVAADADDPVPVRLPRPCAYQRPEYLREIVSDGRPADGFVRRRRRAVHGVDSVARKPVSCRANPVTPTWPP